MKDKYYEYHEKRWPWRHAAPNSNIGGAEIEGYMNKAECIGMHVVTDGNVMFYFKKEVRK